jgi:hypothetical protein
LREVSDIDYWCFIEKQEGIQGFISGYRCWLPQKNERDFSMGDSIPNSEGEGSLREWHGGEFKLIFDIPCKLYIIITKG